jgi:hypothetical protein
MFDVVEVLPKQGAFLGKLKSGLVEPVPNVACHTSKFQKKKKKIVDRYYVVSFAFGDFYRKIL